MKYHPAAGVTEIHPGDAGDCILARLKHTPQSADAWDLDIGWTLSPQCYDEARWAEGQDLLGVLIDFDVPPRTILTAAAGWYQVAAVAAQHALGDKPGSCNSGS